MMDRVGGHDNRFSQVGGPSGTSSHNSVEIEPTRLSAAARLQNMPAARVNSFTSTVQELSLVAPDPALYILGDVSDKSIALAKKLLPNATPYDQAELARTIDTLPDDACSYTVKTAREFVNPHTCIYDLMEILQSLAKIKLS